MPRFADASLTKKLSMSLFQSLNQIASKYNTVHLIWEHYRVVMLTYLVT